MLKKTPGQRVREARKLRTLTQPQLAAAAGITQPSLSEIETGETKEMSGDTLVNLALALGVRAEWLMTGGGGMEATDPELSLTASERALVQSYRLRPHDVVIIPADVTDDAREAIKILSRQTGLEGNIAVREGKKKRR